MNKKKSTRVIAQVVVASVNRPLCARFSNIVAFESWTDTYLFIEIRAAGFYVFSSFYFAKI